MVDSVRSKNKEMDVFKCGMCAKVFYKRESLFSHLADVHRTCCFVCKWIFESKPDLIIHNLVSHDTSFYICGRDKCLLQFKSEDELGAHLEDKHAIFVKRRSPKQMQLCELCGVKFAKAKSLLKHKINHHKVGNVYMCRQCQFCSDSVDGLIEHEWREQGHPKSTLPSTKPHIILDGKPLIPCNKCKTKFRLGTDLIQHMRLKHRDVINNKGAGEWKCGECKKEFQQEISLNHHFIAKHKPRQESVDKLEAFKEEEASLEIEIKIEIKSEPREQNEYYENLLEMTDLKTEAIYNNNKEMEPELSLEETLEEPVYHLADTDYNIKQEYSAVEEADYNIKVKESDEQMVVKDLKKETSEVSNNGVKEVEVGQDMKSGMIRVHLPDKFNNMQDDFIKEFFEASYGKIIKFDRYRKVPRAQKLKGFRSFCWITFEDEKASKFLDKQGHVMLDGCKLKTVALQHSEEMKSLRPAQSGTYDALMQKTGTSPKSSSLLLDLQVGTSKPKEESDTESISSMQGECDSCLMCTSKRHAENLQVSKSRTMQKVKGRSKKKNKKTKHPTMAQLSAQIFHIQSLNTSQHQVISAPLVAARPPPQVAARPPQVPPSRPTLQVPARPPQVPPTRPLPHVPARPPPQYPTMPPTSYYGYQNQPYGLSLGQGGHGYYPAQFGQAYWSGDRTQLGRPYCYYDDAGKLVQRRGFNARMWPY